MQTLAFATRPDIVIQLWINDWRQVVVQQSMYNSVAHASNGNISSFLFVNDLVAVTSMRICIIVQISAELEQVAFEVAFKLCNSLARLFAFAKSPPRAPDVC